MGGLIRGLVSVLLLLGILGFPVVYMNWRERDVRNFRVVQDGVLYRSAQLSPAGLKRIIREYGIRTVVSFRYANHGNTEPSDLWEERLCAELNVNYVRIQPDKWASTADCSIPAQKGIDQFLAVVQDKPRQPVLVHCLRGAPNRHTLRRFSDGMSRLEQCGRDPRTERVGLHEPRP